MHQTFEGDGFVVCSFCPRPYDFDPQAVPAQPWGMDYLHPRVDALGSEIVIAGVAVSPEQPAQPTVEPDESPGLD